MERRRWWRRSPSACVRGIANGGLADALVVEHSGLELLPREVADVDGREVRVHMASENIVIHMAGNASEGIMIGQGGDIGA